MKYLLLIAFLTVTGCASIHPGKFGNEISQKKKDDFIVSVEKVQDFSDPTISFFSVTMENKSDKWIKIKNTDFNCGKECNKKVNVIVGDDLVSWAKAKKDQMDIKKQNEKLLLSGLTTGGLLFSILSNNNDFVIGGVIVAASSGATTLVKDLNYEKTKLESPNWVPAEHLFSNISVPTSLFTRRWILVSHPKNFDIGGFIINFKTIEDEELKYVFKI